MEGIIINELTSKSPNDTRGDVYEWCKGLPGKQVTVYQRIKGSKFGNHFHKGSDPSKNPERMLLLEGTMKFEAWNKKGEKLVEEISAISELIISPRIAHRAEALSDVLFIEYREKEFDPEHPDTFPVDEY